jgi:hypothetical protein
MAYTNITEQTASLRAARKLNEKLGKRIEELEAELDWILVSEEMPEQVEGHWGSELVLATDGKQAWVSKYNYSAYYWGFVPGDIDITHWKPIILP